MTQLAARTKPEDWVCETAGLPSPLTVQRFNADLMRVRALRQSQQCKETEALIWEKAGINRDTPENWYHALPHGSRANTSARARVVQYINMSPLRDFSKIMELND